MRKKIYILTIFILFNLFLEGEIFDFNKVFVVGAATIQSTVRITVCGNGVIETGEQCDPLGPVLGGQTCQSRGYAGGTLSCWSYCEFNTSACTSGGGGGGGGSYLPEIKEKILKLADFNGDARVDIADLSILLYYASHGYQARYDLNKDGTIDIVDISIVMYYWI